jgi:lipoic acid synthetase
MTGLFAPCLDGSTRLCRYSSSRMPNGPHTLLGSPPDHSTGDSVPGKAELLARLEAAGLPSNAKKPGWLRVAVPGGERYLRVREALTHLRLHTVCQEAHCPNVAECWGGTATVMLMGDICTRACRFCNVKTARHPPPLDPDEPRRLAEAVRALKLDYLVVTSVDRDDLPDGGAGHFAEAIRLLKEIPQLLVEVLTPDFRGDPEAVRTIGRSAPDVFGSNLETVRRLSPAVRDPRAGYDQTLGVLAQMKREFGRVYTKSSIMVGLGETEAEIDETMGDLRDAGVDILTLGQYLRPSARHLPVLEFVAPDRFRDYKVLGERHGFRYVASGPLVRSSYRAEFFIKGEIESAERLGDMGVSHAAGT